MSEHFDTSSLGANVVTLSRSTMPAGGSPKHRAQLTPIDAHAFDVEQSLLVSVREPAIEIVEFLSPHGVHPKNSSS